MVSDYRECKNLAEQEGGGKDCRTCSLNTSTDFGFGLCELPVVREDIERKGRSHGRHMNEEFYRKRVKEILLKTDGEQIRKIYYFLVAMLGGTIYERD